MDEKERIIFTQGVPPKNKFIQLLFLMRWPLGVSFFRKMVERHLKNCENVIFIPGFRTLYANIYAKNVALGDTFFIDYAPIYIGEGSKFSFNNIVITSTHNLKNFNEVYVWPIYIGKNT